MIWLKFVNSLNSIDYNHSCITGIVIKGTISSSRTAATSSSTTGTSLGQMLAPGSWGKTIGIAAGSPCIIHQIAAAPANSTRDTATGIPLAAARNTLATADPQTWVCDPKR